MPSHMLVKQGEGTKTFHFPTLNQPIMRRYGLEWIRIIPMCGPMQQIKRKLRYSHRASIRLITFQWLYR